MLHERYYLCVCVELPTTKTIITHHLPIVPFNKCCTFFSVLPIQLVQNNNRKIKVNFDKIYEKHNNNNNVNAFMCAVCTLQNVNSVCNVHMRTYSNSYNWIENKNKKRTKKSIRFKDALLMWCARDHSYCTQRIYKEEKKNNNSGSNEKTENAKNLV